MALVRKTKFKTNKIKKSTRSVINVNKSETNINISMKPKNNVNKLSETNTNNNMEVTESNDPTPSTSTNEVSNKPISTSGIERYITIIKRKRSPNSSKVISNPKTKVTKINSAQNRFAELSSDDEEDRVKIDNPQDSLPKPRPPPIYLREVSSNDLINKLKACVGENFYIADIKQGRISETKIQAKEERHYCAITDLLEKEKKNFYTYQLKSAKGLKVVLKGIDHNVNTEDIKKDLERLGFNIKNVSRMLNKQKIPQPMFKVELTPESSKPPKGETHPIYDVKYVLHRKIVVEEPRKNSSLAQCQNCQEYGHTKAYCKLSSVCVICGGSHLTINCTHGKSDTSVKRCSNCNGNHTANYRGCPIYLHLLNKQKQPIQTKTSHRDNYQEYQLYQQQKQLQQQQHQQPNSAPNRSNLPTAPTYADITKNNFNHQPQNNLNNQDSITQILLALLNNMQQLTNSIQEMQKSLSAQNAILIKLAK